MCFPFDLLLLGLSIFLPLLSLDLFCATRLPTSWMKYFFLPLLSALSWFFRSYNWVSVAPEKHILTPPACFSPGPGRAECRAELDLFNYILGDEFKPFSFCLFSVFVDYVAP